MVSYLAKICRSTKDPHTRITVFPQGSNLKLKGTLCHGSVELVFDKGLKPFVMKCIWLERYFKSRIK